MKTSKTPVETLHRKNWNASSGTGLWSSHSVQIILESSCSRFVPMNQPLNYKSDFFSHGKWSFLTTTNKSLSEAFLLWVLATIAHLPHLVTGCLRQSHECCRRNKSRWYYYDSYSWCRRLYKAIKIVERFSYALRRAAILSLEYEPS